MSEKCPNCGFVVSLSPRERRSLVGEIERLQARVDELKGLPMQVAGWCYADACVALEDGIDMRKVAVPDIMARLKKDIPALAATEQGESDE